MTSRIIMYVIILMISGVCYTGTVCVDIEQVLMYAHAHYAQ